VRVLLISPSSPASAMRSSSVMALLLSPGRPTTRVLIGLPAKEAFLYMAEMASPGSVLLVDSPSVSTSTKRGRQVALGAGPADRNSPVPAWPVLWVAAD